MDSNNWRAAQAQMQIPGQAMGSESVVPPGMEASDWRNQLQADSRQIIVNMLMETLQRHLPFSGQEGLQELKKIAVRFEEKIYAAATSQSDYVRKITLKMLTIETKSQNPMANPLQPNTASNRKNLQDPDSSAQTGNSKSGDWQEEIYQKIKSLNKMYFPELNEMYQRMAAKLQQHDSLPQQPKNEQLEKLGLYKLLLERLLMFLQTNKNDIQHSHKEKIVGVEKQIVNILNSNRPRKPVSSLQQGQIPQPHSPAMQQPQQPQPQISQMHIPEDLLASSPQLDRQNLLASHVKAETPLQSENSPFSVPSPSTSMVPSPMPGDPEKINPGVSSLSNAGNIEHHSTAGASGPAQSLAIGTPGISASPLLAEYTSPDETHGAASTIVSGNTISVEQPLECLIKVVKSMSQKALSASISDISSVVSVVDNFAGSAPGNGSRAAVGEDLVAMTKCRLQARNFFTQDGPSGTKKMRRYTSAMSHDVSSTCSVIDNFRHINGSESDGDSTGATSVKRPKIEANHALEEELHEINQRLIDTAVYINEDDVDPTAVAAASEGGGGTIVKCSFSAVALSPYLKSQYASAQMSPIQPLRLLIPNDYPNCSPILLDKFPVEVSKEYEDVSRKARSRFSISLRALARPLSLGEIVRSWDICARAVISEYAQEICGGTFSSNYGTWEDCSSTA